MNNSSLKNRQSFVLFLFLMFFGLGFSQTTLSEGDIAITGFNSDFGDQFSFVLLTDITTTTQIKFTDNGWMSSGTFRTGEGVLNWTANQDLTCGTEIIIFRSSDSNPFSSTLGTITATSGSFILSTAGDQITAFQGTLSTPTLIYLLNFNSLSWTDATGSNNTALPNNTPYTLTNGFSAVSIGNTDNGVYDCSVNNNTSALSAAISTEGNWIKNNAAVLTLGTCDYFCSSDTFSWVNLQSPGVGTMTFGNSGFSYWVYARAYELGVTNLGGAGSGISAWIGISTVDASNTSDFRSSNWTWLPATFNLDVGNDDEYWVDVASQIHASGTYFIVSRFKRNDGPYVYGGYNVGGGGFWDGSTNVSGTLTVTTTCSSTVTWNGVWAPTTPDINTEVIIASDYDSTTLPSFSACSLTINPGVQLTIDNNKYVEVNNDVTINGVLLIRSSGTLVQNNNDASITGSANIQKSTAQLDAWYEYTYWSSPVTNETVGTALVESDINRRFWFNAANFMDATAENNNNNATVLGQDDIDDNGDDWQYANASMVMTPGVGFAATHNSVGFMGLGTSYIYNFNGTPNNGIISVPVERNDGEVNDFNWNFIGNPYPSAIDVDLFFSKNLYNPTTNPTGTLTGSLYLWSQDTPPQDTNNGNETFNFSTSDYALINGSGQIAGGDGLLPTRFIPSGQGFFMAYSDAIPSPTGAVEFSNAMRVTGNNNQFFRLSTVNQPNKIRINLTSNNGVFNQALVAYIPGATDNYDGMYYDAPRNLASGTAAIVYSTIVNHPRQFAIQGKNPQSLNQNEVIYLGFKNTIAIQDTQFTISIADLEGNFMTNTPIYLIDNLFGNEHDLTQSNYTFTSEKGVFNDRFEIRFASTLNVDNQKLINNQLIIINNSKNYWDIYTTHQSKISQVIVCDLFGRVLISSEAENQILVTLNTKTFTQSVYVVKIKLFDGTEMIKKVFNQ